MKIPFYIAIFDHANPGPQRDYWVHRHNLLNGDMLSEVYYQAISKAVLALATATVAGGALSVKPQWVCFFRLFDSGPDKHGRGGHFIAVCAFTDRAKAIDADLSEVCRHPTFKDVADAYQRGSGSPFLSGLQFELDCLPLLPSSLSEAAPPVEGVREFHGEQSLKEAFDVVARLLETAAWALEFRTQNGSVTATLQWTSPGRALIEKPPLPAPPAISVTGLRSAPEVLNPIPKHPWRLTVILWMLVAVATLIVLTRESWHDWRSKPPRDLGNVSLPIVAFVFLLIGVWIGWKLRGRWTKKIISPVKPKVEKEGDSR